MYDYEAEVKTQITDFFLKVAVPFLIPFYLLSNLLDWVVVPALALPFLVLRLTLLPVAGLGFVALKRKWTGPWYRMIVWAVGVVLSIHLTCMAYFSGRFSSSPYLYTLNLIAGLLLLSPMRFYHLWITLGMIYFPYACLLILQYGTGRRAEVNVPMISLTGAMILLFGLLAIGLDRLRQKAFVHKVRLFFLATTDALSGLKLRRYFFHRFLQELSIAFRRGGKISVSAVVIDIDAFKEVNDRYGHPAGDRCIRAIGEIIRTSIRIYDTACRLGGEEFAILLPETDLEGARIVSERIRQAVQMASVKAGAAKVRLTVSAGIAGIDSVLSDDFTEAQRTRDAKLLVIRHMLELIKRADEELYQGKRSGKNCVRVSSPMPLLPDLDAKDVASLKSYLVYFDQDLFSVYPEEVSKDPSLFDEEVNFYPEEFFFRRCIESMSRNLRNPQWKETLALIRVLEGDQVKVKHAMSKMFRSADTLCMFEPGLYGIIFFSITREALRSAFDRMKKHLSQELHISESSIKVAACLLEYARSFQHAGAKASHRLNYADFNQRVTELLSLLRFHRFAVKEDLCYYAPEGSAEPAA
ncbi:MAG: GGDEF domain-containing protein [Candidatus Omnitrophota bacterium]|jgi:diguanylate cyclase (GGDEF)-like protein